MSARQAFTTARTWDTEASSQGSGRSTVHCSTRPVSVMSTSSSFCGASGTSSMCRIADLVSDGYCTTATCRVS